MKKDTPESDILSKRISKLKARYDPAVEENKSLSGSHAVSELVGCVIVGSGLGYGADYFLSTLPWGTIAGFMCGCFTGFYVIYKLMQQNMEDESAKNQ